MDRSGAPETVLARLAGMLAPEADAALNLAGVTDCLDHPDEDIRQLAALVLGRIGAPAADALVRALSPKQPLPVRMNGALGLAAIGPGAAVAVRELCRCLTDADDDLRQTASIALSKIGPAAVPALRMMLRFPNADAVMAAVSALTLIGAPAAEAIPELEAVGVRAPLPLQLSCAAAVARASGDPSRILPLLSHALSDPDPAVRKDALSRIGELRELGRPATPDVLQLLQDPAAPVRACAALTLARLRALAGQAVQPLIRVLDDPEPEVRLNALIALSSFGRDANVAVPALQLSVEDTDANVSAAARAALEGIPSGSGKDGLR